MGRKMRLHEITGWDLFLELVIDGAMYLHRRRSNPSSDSDREPEN